MSLTALRASAVMALAALMLVSCGSPGDDAGAGGPPSPAPTLELSPVPSVPAPDRGKAELVQPRPGMENVRSIPWDEAEVSEDGRSVTVFFWSGVEPCYVLDRVEVNEGRRRIEITLYQGSAPLDEDVACIEIAVYKATVVELEEPVGDRRIIDGHDG